MSMSWPAYSITPATRRWPLLKKNCERQDHQRAEIERADSLFDIVMWTADNPGGSPEALRVCITVRVPGP